MTKKQLKEDNTLALKKELKLLYRNIEKYFAINTYYEIVKKKNPDKLVSLLLSRIKTGHKVLEFGLNPGILTVEAALKNADAIGIDASPMKVVIAESLKHIEYEKFEFIQKLDKMKLPFEKILSCKFRVMPLNYLEFKDESFDIIFSNAGIEQGDLSSYFDEIHRCLDYKGELIIKIDLKRDLTLLIQKAGKEEHVIKATRPEIVKYLEENKMKMQHSEIIYKESMASFLISVFPFLKGKKFFGKFESIFIVHFQKG